MRQIKYLIISCTIIFSLVFFTPSLFANHSTLRSDPFNTNPINSSGQGSSSFGTSLRESIDHEAAQREGRSQRPYIYSGGLHGTSSSMTSSAVATEAFVTERINQVATAITYPAEATDTCWAIISADNNGITGWTRIGSTSYYVRCDTDSAPTLPPNSAWLMGPVTIAGSAITAVVDRRFPNPHGLYVSPTDPIYGAVADGGTTNNVAAFNAAEETAAIYGMKLYIPRGENFYGFNSTWTIGGSTKYGLVIEGSGDRSMLVNMNAAGQHLITLNDCRSCVLRDFSMAGHASGGHGIYITNLSSRGKTENLFCRNMGQDCLHVNSGLGWTHTNPRFSTNTYGPSVIGPFPYAAASVVADNGIVLEGSANTGTQTIVGPLIEGMGVWGVNIGEASLNTTIIGGTIEGNGTGEVITAGWNTHIINTNFESSGTGPSIQCNSCRTFLLDGANGGQAGAGVLGRIHIAGDATDVVLRNLIAGSILIDSTARRTRLTNVNYGNWAGSSIVDNAPDTVIEQVSNSSNANVQVAGKGSRSHVNYATNGNMESWNNALGASDRLLEFSTVGGATITRTGVNESTNVVKEGRYAVLVTSAVATSGIEYQGSRMPAYADWAGQTMTVTVWARGVGGGESLQIAIYYNNGATVRQCAGLTLTGTYAKFGCSFPHEAGYAGYGIRLTGSTSHAFYLDGLRITLGDDQSYGVHDDLQIDKYGYCERLLFGATFAIYQDACSFWAAPVDSNITAITLNNPVIGKPLWIKFVQDPAGNFTVTGWPATVNWVGAAAPVMTATARRTDLFCLLWDGNNWWECGRFQNQD